MNRSTDLNRYSRGSRPYRANEIEQRSNMTDEQTNENDSANNSPNVSNVTSDPQNQPTQ